MFDDLDIDKLLEEETKREALKKEYGNYGEAELELSLMRESFIKETDKKNAKALSKLEESINEIGDGELPFSKEVERIAKELEDTEKSNEVNTETDNTETNTEANNIVDTNTADVESDVDNSKPVENSWLKEKEELLNRDKQQAELLALMFNEIENLKKQKEVPVIENKPVVEEVKQITDDEIAQFAKNITNAISFGKEDEASENLIKLLASMKQKPVEVKKEISEADIENVINKREQKKYDETFVDARAKFFETEDGKKIIADEDLFDLYQVKFNKLKNSGVHLNPEDLFKQASEKTLGVKVNSSIAKPVPKVSDSLKEDVSKLEESKKQAVKPNGSSNTTTSSKESSKKFDPLQEYKDFIFKTTGQKI